ncbi:hypothetical protein NBH00_15055 [Paraconexibacter antarcticus]|uniref:Meckel syndrome type 1 protein n=1 Tax=Paraconexibacter antarcticus TaxID=2949664 RepID=A0ABY5DLH4_9ACTN|nr:hypothetical protein [Paraconexibacter antarcticus]UTI62676.1 hypothetical protein NBH00_15055 [Paraconexibacter antarcticus]
MDDLPQAAVTPQGVRDGDPAVLTALVARRGPAVLAFCEAVCAPEDVPPALAEAFARFRALVVAVGDTSGVDPESYLLGATRHAAASMARPPSDGRGVLRVLGRGASPETYAAVPSLLAARADSMLGEDDLERLHRLLERSPGCREVEAAFRRAERGYRSPPDRPLDVTTTALAVSAMQGAAPLADGVPIAEAPEPPLAVELTPVPAPTPVVEPEPVAEPQPIAEAPAPELAPDPEPAPAPEEQPTAVHAVLAPDEPAEHAAPEEEPAPFILDTPEPVEELPLPVAAVGVALPHGLDAGAVPAGEPDHLTEPDPDIVPAFAATGRTRRRLPSPRLPRPRLPAGGGRSLPRHSETAVATDEDAELLDPGPVYRLLLPAIAVIVAVLVMLAIAGVFGGGDPTPAVIVGPAAAVTAPGLTTSTAAVAAAPSPARRRPTRRAPKRAVGPAPPATATTPTATAATPTVPTPVRAGATTPVPTARPAGAAAPARATTAPTPRKAKVESVTPTQPAAALPAGDASTPPASTTSTGGGESVYQPATP